jgi:hypothetical protein
VAVEAPRSPRVEALIDLAARALDADTRAATGAPGVGPRVVVHVDAAALTSDAAGRSEMGDGPVIAPETARRLGWNAELVAQVERDSLPLSVGRTRRTVPQALRRLLESRDDNTCRFPGCERQAHLQAHHRQHWAHGGEASLENLGSFATSTTGTARGRVHDRRRPRERASLPQSLRPRLRHRSTETAARGRARAPQHEHAAGPHDHPTRHGLGQPLDLARTVATLKDIAA